MFALTLELTDGNRVRFIRCQVQIWPIDDDVAVSAIIHGAGFLPIGSRGCWQVPLVAQVTLAVAIFLAHSAAADQNGFQCRVVSAGKVLNWTRSQGYENLGQKCHFSP